MSRQKRIQQGRQKPSARKAAVDCPQEVAASAQVASVTSNENAAGKVCLVALPLSTLAGQIWMTPGCRAFGPYVILAVAWASFFAMACAKDYSGGRFISTAAWLFIGCTAMLLPLEGSAGEICRLLLLLLAPAYILLSLGSFIRHQKQGTLSLLPNSVFRRQGGSCL